MLVPKPCILLYQTIYFTQSQRKPLAATFSAVSSRFFCNGFLIWGKCTIWTIIKTSEIPEKCICPSKILSDFIIFNALFKELYRNSGFPEQGTCDNSASDKLLPLPRIISPGPANLHLVIRFLSSLWFNVSVKSASENSLNSGGITSKMKAGNSVKLFKEKHLDASDMLWSRWFPMKSTEVPCLLAPWTFWGRSASALVHQHPGKYHCGHLWAVCQYKYYKYQNPWSSC